MNQAKNSNRLDYFSELTNISQNNLIIKEIIKLTKSLFNKKSSYKNAIPKFFMILLIIIFKHMLNSSIFLSYFKKFLIKAINLVLYKKYIYDNFNDKNHINYYICKNLISKDYEVIKNEKNYQFNILFYKSIKNILNSSKKEFEENNDEKTLYYEFVNNGYLKTNPGKYFPSSNFLKLSQMIETFLEINTIIGNNKILGILINSEPGQGKSVFMSYLSSLKICKRCFRIDMNNFLNTDFETLIPSATHSSNLTSVFMIDEFDKYIQYYIEKKYQMYEKDCIKEKLQSYDSFENFYKNKKIDFLFSIAKLLDNNKSICPTVIIFCSNNFETIFNGVDMTHFNSLVTRFKKVKFESCDRNNLIGYLKFYNNILVNTKYYIPEQVLEYHIKDIKEDLSITYRELDQISIDCNRDIPKIIEIINNK